MAKKNKGLKALLGVAGAATAAGAVYLAIGNTMVKRILHRSAAAEQSWNPDKQLETKRLEDLVRDDPYFMLRKEGVEWYREQPIKKVTAISQRGERLHADLLQNPESDVFIISLHGYACSPEIDGCIVRVFTQWGYNVLCPHLCGHGESENEYVSMGWLDRIDVLAWIDYLNRKYHNPQIILHGISMGGATVMMVTGETLPGNVKCAIEDCGYTSVWDEFSVQCREMFDRSPFPLLHAADTVNRLKSGFALKEASSLEQVKKSNTPTLFIHGDKDDFVPFWMLDILYENAQCEKEKLIIPGAAHAEAAGKDPELYFGTIKTFIEKHLEQ